MAPECTQSRLAVLIWQIGCQPKTSIAILLRKAGTVILTEFKHVEP
jgi:hypothetical protein